MRIKDLANFVIMLKQKLATVKLERSNVKAQLENVDSPASEKTKVQALRAKIVDNSFSSFRKCDNSFNTSQYENLCGH